MSPYRVELNAIYHGFVAAHPGKTVADLEVDADGNLTSRGAKDMHEALCKTAGVDGFDMIADWNRRSPENDQW